MSREPERVLIGLTELARMLAIGRSTAERYVQTGHLPPPIRLGNRMKWKLADVREWIDAGCPRDRRVP